MTVRDGSSSGNSLSGSGVTQSETKKPKPDGGMKVYDANGSLVSGNGGVTGTPEFRAPTTSPAPVSTPAVIAPSESLVSRPSGGGAGAVDTTVTQRPPENAQPVSPGTVNTGGPRSDFSTVLAGQVQRRPERNPARSTNFVSLIGGAGGLGRRSENSKRTLIGGA
jgi:hypothetical protein